MNGRQWRYRLKNNYCWKCNIPLEEMETHDAYKCKKCGEMYSYLLLMRYKEREGFLTPHQSLKKI